ncbi:MAG: hypothetical protein KAW39_08810 [Thermoplasmata archaeon]|nr:hypothetical protein [Thermoplasmata archaeon]
MPRDERGGRCFEWVEGFADMSGSSRLKKTPGFEPEEIRRAVLDVIERNRDFPPVFSLHAHGICNVFDMDSKGELTEMWEQRDSAPNDSDGTLNFSLGNPFPHDFTIVMWTKSTIFVSDIDDPRYKEIAHMSKKKLERYMRKFEQDLNAKNLGAVSEYYEDLVWRYGFK